MMRAGVIVLGVVVLLVLANTFYVVNEYDQVIITQFGKPVGDPLSTPGLKLKLPMVQQVHRFDKRFLEWDGDPNQLPTKDKRFIYVDTYARWRISDPLLFFQRLRDEQGAQSRLDDILDGETRNAIANHDLVELIRSTNREPEQTELEEADMSQLEIITDGRDVIRQQILEKTQERTSDLGIEILDLQFKRVNYVEEVQRKVYERMIAERKRIADRFRSEGEGAALRIRGERDRDLKRIQSEAYREAQNIVGQADSVSTYIYARAYNGTADSRDFYQFLKTMETYKNTIDPGTLLLLSTDGEFYRMLKDPRKR